MSTQNTDDKIFYLTKENYKTTKKLPDNYIELYSSVFKFEGFIDWEICGNIKKITLQGTSCKLTSLDSFRYFPNVEEIKIYTGKLLTDISFVKELPELKILDVNFAPVVSLDGFKNHKNITEIRARKSAVTSISEIETCKKLKVLHLEKSKLKSIENIKNNFPNLELLWIWETKVKDLSPLEGMTSIKNLDVTMLKPKSWDFIKTLTGTEILDLCKSSFSDVQLLLPLTNLKYVRFSGCDVDFSTEVYRNFEKLIKKRKVGIKRLLPELAEVKEDQKETTRKIFNSLRHKDSDDYFFSEIENVDINNTDERNSFLHLAVIYKKKKVVKKLLELGIDVNIQAQGGDTALHYVVSEWPDYEIAKLIIDAGADVNLTNSYGFGALTKSIYINNSAVTRLLLDAGADPDIPSQFGHTALDSAIECGRDDLVKMIEEKKEKGKSNNKSL